MAMLLCPLRSPALNCAAAPAPPAWASALPPGPAAAAAAACARQLRIHCRSGLDERLQVSRKSTRWWPCLALPTDFASLSAGQRWRRIPGRSPRSSAGALVGPCCVPACLLWTLALRGPRVRTQLAADFFRLLHREERASPPRPRSSARSRDESGGPGASASPLAPGPPAGEPGVRALSASSAGPNTHVPGQDRETAEEKRCRFCGIPRAGNMLESSEARFQVRKTSKWRALQGSTARRGFIALGSSGGPVCVPYLEPQVYVHPNSGQVSDFLYA